ncbi:periplasmic heavy metal sensor (plasmid) [Azospirillum argentinense]|uniref:Periplasmic heavy metal sensor n=1 Tax=Azospirillum argentinense TaxID=2970906 RepID=A0A4D8PPI8_9PROT|nr:periplasmic heavy metal sensor [Azospirillum argentinense]QCN99144.1 periplasmic heavy metal sensor [Azospirillum argentinense]
MSRPIGRPTAPRRWPWYLLIGSLGMNMLLGGILAAQALHLMPPPPPPDPGQGLERFVERAERELSPADAAVLRRGYEAERMAVERMHQNMEAMRRQLRDSMSAPTFDPDGLRRALDQAHATEADLRGRLDSRVIEVLSQLSPEGRRKLVEMGPPR